MQILLFFYVAAESEHATSHSGQVTTNRLSVHFCTDLLRMSTYVHLVVSYFEVRKGMPECQTTSPS